MRVADNTIRSAFRYHNIVYASLRGWSVSEIVRLWRNGQHAFGPEANPAAFEQVYDALRKGWQVFRPIAYVDIPTVGQVYGVLSQLDDRFRTLSLSQLSYADVPALWSLLSQAGAIKRDKYKRPSLMAVSKFMHFWNPRLFVIVDDEVMGRFVFKHTWLNNAIQVFGENVDSYYPEQELAGQFFASYGLRYLDFLAWSSRLLQDNPSIESLFAQYVLKHANGEEPPEGFEDFEGAAIEWLLLGLVELPPAGVELDTVQ